MKKLILALLIFAVMGGAAFAFDILSYPPPVDGGDIMIDIGLGLRSTGYGGANWKIPPLFVQAEFALPVNVPISVGGLFTLCSYKYDYGFSSKYEWTWTDMTIAGRANWHWGFDVSWLDFYTGASLGYTHSSWKSKPSYPTAQADYGGFYLGFQAGVHFYFTKMIGAMVELGYPYWIKAGVAIKF